MTGVSTRTRVWIGLVVAGLAATLTVSLPAGAEPADAGLEQALDEILADERLVGAEASVVVRDAENGEVRYEHQPEGRLVPASNTKLTTSAAAMELLGPDHKFRTDVLTDGSRQGATLQGDLYLRGTGDPTMLAEDYDKLAAKVAAAGIEEVTGQLVADDTRFDDERLGWSWAADDESAYYSSQISPLTVAPDTDYDAGTVYLEVTPGAAPGDQPEVTMVPQNDYVTVEVLGTTVAEGEPDTHSIQREHGGNTITVTGDVPVGAATAASWISVWEPTGYAASVFTKALAKHGVQVAGDTQLGQATPSSAESVATHDSMPLAELLVPFLKLSNNNHAEVLTKAIGHEVAGSGTWSAGLEAIEGYLEKEGVAVDTLRQKDGSGLSRANNIPSAELATLLHSIQDTPWFDDWYAALPIACEEERIVGGTLRTRMCDTPAAGNAHAKTGSLTGASALSGYVTDADGKKLIFSIVLNNYLAPSVKDIEDSIVVTLASHGAESSTVEAPPAAPERKPGGERGPAGDLECSWLKPQKC